MSELVDVRAHVAWRAALFAAALNAFGSPLELVLGRDVPGIPHWTPLLAAGTGLTLLVLLTLRRHRPTRAFAAAAFLVNTASIAIMLSIDNRHWALLGTRWAPFQANKLGALTVGLLTPELAVGIVSILAYTLPAVVQWALLTPAVRAHLARGEPLVTCIFAAFGVALLIMATRRIALVRRLAQKEQEAASLEQLARALLAVRDFANTPLQTIESATALTRLHHPESDVEMRRIERALERLRRLNQLLSRHENHIRWEAGDESFDPIARLQAVGDEDTKH